MIRFGTSTVRFDTVIKVHFDTVIQVQFGTVQVQFETVQVQFGTVQVKFDRVQPERKDYTVLHFQIYTQPQGVPENMRLIDFS